MGKSGIVGKKIAATLASTGTIINEGVLVTEAKYYLQEHPCRALVVLDLNEDIVGLFGRDIFN